MFIGRNTQDHLEIGALWLKVKPDLSGLSVERKYRENWFWSEVGEISFDGKTTPEITERLAAFGWTVQMVLEQYQHLTVTTPRYGEVPVVLWTEIERGLTWWNVNTHENYQPEWGTNPSGRSPEEALVSAYKVVTDTSYKRRFAAMTGDREKPLNIVLNEDGVLTLFPNRPMYDSQLNVARDRGITPEEARTFLEGRKDIELDTRVESFLARPDKVWTAIDMGAEPLSTVASALTANAEVFRIDIIDFGWAQQGAFPYVHHVLENGTVQVNNYNHPLAPRIDPVKTRARLWGFFPKTYLEGKTTRSEWNWLRDQVRVMAMVRQETGGFRCLSFPSTLALEVFAKAHLTAGTMVYFTTPYHGWCQYTVGREDVLHRTTFISDTVQWIPDTQEWGPTHLNAKWTEAAKLALVERHETER